ncbi:MAG: hypothetical protein QM669_12435 [Siphonobacter sp.]
MNQDEKKKKKKRRWWWVPATVVVVAGIIGLTARTRKKTPQSQRIDEDEEPAIGI